MIPKIIHYCWFGKNPLPPLAIKCIDSWKKYLPDYEIKEWNEDNFDVNIIPYTQEAYEMQKYAFVSDYARFWILYKYGGLYFDTDVEIIKPLDDIIARGPFMGCENELIPGTTAILTVAPGLGLGCTPGQDIYKKLLKLYDTLSFRRDYGNPQFKTIVGYTTELLIKNGLQCVNGIQCVDGIHIYPAEYFCPINIITQRLHITQNTRTIHHYAASWVDENNFDKIKKSIRKLLPEPVLFFYNKFAQRLNILTKITNREG